VGELGKVMCDFEKTLMAAIEESIPWAEVRKMVFTYPKGTVSPDFLNVCVIHDITFVFLDAR
jgi:hypothetical protein